MVDMQKDIENSYADAIWELRCVKSSLTVLQQAVQNENDVPTLSDIDGSLEMILDRLSKGVDLIEQTTHKQFASIDLADLKNQTGLSEEPQEVEISELV